MAFTLYHNLSGCINACVYVDMPDLLMLGISRLQMMQHQVQGCSCCCNSGATRLAMLSLRCHVLCDSCLAGFVALVQGGLALHRAGQL